MILSPLDPILISHDLPDWGQWALSDSYNAATNTLAADRPLKWSVGVGHYARLRARDGRPSAALAVSRGASDACLVFAEPPPSIDVQGCEPSHIAFGAGTAWQVQAKTPVSTRTAKAMPTFPTQLPAPLINGYTLQPQDVGIRTSMDSGIARTRKRFSTRPITTVPVNWLMTQNQFAIFDAWMLAYASD
eukprot:gene60558-80760_t